MATFTLGTASQATGCAKSTILRAIKAGRISAARDELGQWSIEPVELFRCFPPLVVPSATPATANTARIERDATTDLLVTELRQVITDLRRGQEDLRQDRDHWRTEAADWKAQAQRLIPPPQHAATAEQPPQPPVSRLRRAWRWMRATR
jgi:hypothetical protein